MQKGLISGHKMNTVREKEKWTNKRADKQYWQEKEKWTNKGTNKQYVADSLIHSSTCHYQALYQISEL